MKANHSTKFHLSIIALALSASFAHAEDMPPADTTTLADVKVIGTAVPTRVTRPKLDRETATDMKQVMKDQIGMQVGGGNGVAQYFSIRGNGEDLINLNVDGTSQSTKMFHHQSRFMLDPALIKSINVEKGTGSASAGFGALAGTVRVTTVDAKDLLVGGKPFGFRIGASGSSNKGENANVGAYTHINGFDALVLANFLNNSDYKDGNGQVNKGSKLKQHGYLAKIGYDFNENHSVRLSMREEYQKGSRSNKAEYQTDYIADGRDNVYKGFEGSKQVERTVNLEYHGRGLGFADKIDANVFRIKTNDYKPPKGFEDNKQKDDAAEESTMTATGANLGLSSRLFGNHALKYGVNFRQEKSDPSDKEAWLKVLNITAHPEKKTEYGVYAEGIWDFHPVTLTTGLRYDHFKYHAADGRTASKGQLNPSLGVIYDVTPEFSLLGTFNQASRAPRLNEALLANERAGAAADLDTNLKPETARRAEIGFKWKSNNGFDISGSIFHQNIKDLIVYKWATINAGKGTVSDRGRIYNGGRLKTHGYELDASYRNGGLTARVGVSYTKPKLTGEMYYGEKMIADEHHENSFTFWNTGRQWLTSLSYRFDNPNLEIGWRGRYVQSVNFTGSARKIGSGIIRDKKSGYGVHDVFLNWQPLNNDTLNVNAGINNVFNKQYRSHSQTYFNGVGRVPFYERGRELTLGVNYRF